MMIDGSMVQLIFPDRNRYNTPDSGRDTREGVSKVCASMYAFHMKMVVAQHSQRSITPTFMSGLLICPGYNSGSMQKL